MTTKEFRESLEQKTYADVEELGRRVFYTLTDVSEGKSISVADASQPTKLHYAAHRQAMFLSMCAKSWRRRAFFRETKSKTCSLTR